MLKATLTLFSLSLTASFAIAACGDGTEADRLAVGAACTTNDDCYDEGQVCIPFKGGYCGIVGCVEDIDCPDASLCVTHTDATNYCFRVCDTKADCNRNRPVEVEANCSSNITFADQGAGKACVPPSAN